MTRDKTKKDYSKQVLTDKIEELERKIGTEKAKYCYLVAGGKNKYAAMTEVFGYHEHHQVLRLTNKKNDSGKLIALLKEEAEGHIYEGFKLDKATRLEHLTNTALQAHHKYIESGEAAHGAVYAKIMTIINSMTGDNAPTQIQHLISITDDQLEAMSHSERTEAYKRMMSGKLELVHTTKNTQHTIEQIPVELTAQRKN